MLDKTDTEHPDLKHLIAALVIILVLVLTTGFYLFFLSFLTAISCLNPPLFLTSPLNFGTHTAHAFPYKVIDLRFVLFNCVHPWFPPGMTSICNVNI